MAIDEKRVKKLLKLYSGIIHSFSATYITYCFCNSGTVKKPRIERIHIYICYAKCKKQCNNYLQKVYICQHLKCDNWPICVLSGEKKKKRYCKKFNLTDERRHLVGEYKKFIKIYRVYRGLKIDPERTLKYIDEMKAKRKREKEISDRMAM